MTKRILLITILLIAAGLRLYFAFTCNALPDYSDMAIYNNAAMAEGIPAFPPPGYPLFLRLIYSIFGAYNYKAVFVVQGLLSVFTVFLVYAVARAASVPDALSVGGESNGVPEGKPRGLGAAERTGLIACAIASIYPYFIAYNLTTLTESLSLLLVMIVLYTAVSPMREGRRSVLAGLVLSIGFFVKPALLFFAPGLFFGVKKKLILVSVVLAVLAPYLIHGVITGEGEKRGARLIYKAYNPRAAQTPHFKMNETELGSKEATDEEYISETMNFISSNKWKTLDMISYKASLLITKGWDSHVLKGISRENRHFVNLMIYGYLPVMIFGFIGLFRYCDDKNRIMMLMMASYLAIHILITIFKLRYRLLVEPMIIIYAAIALSRIIDSLTLVRDSRYPEATRAARSAAR